MQIVNSSFHLDRFLDSLATARARVLIIDYGALALQSDHDPCLPIPAVRRLLEQIRVETNTRLVLISDRHCRTVDSLLGLNPAPEIWGVGGLERLLPDGTYELSSLDERALRGLAEADDWAEAAGLLPWIEQKPGGIALSSKVPPGHAESDSMRSRAWTADGPRDRYGIRAQPFLRTLNTGSLNFEFLRGLAWRPSKPLFPRRTGLFPSPTLATECSVNSHSMLWVEGA